MLFEYVTLKVGERIQEGDLVYVPSLKRYQTVENTSFCMTVAPGSVYMRPVTGPAANSHFDRHELAEIEEEKEAAGCGLTSEQEFQDKLGKANDLVEELRKRFEASEKYRLELVHKVLMLMRNQDKLNKANAEIEELRQRLRTSEERRLRLMHTDIVTAAVTETETELERKAWDLYCRLDVNEEGAFRQAERFIAERDRRRKESGK